MAWLTVYPEKSEKARYEMYVAGSPYLELPALSSYERSLADLWKEAGQVTQTSKGPLALTWHEIVSWAERCFSVTSVEYDEDEDGVFIPVTRTNNLLLDHELQTIRTMSQEYASEYYQKDPRRECPKEVDTKEIDSLAESTALGEAFLLLFGDNSQQNKTKQN